MWRRRSEGRPRSLLKRVLVWGGALVGIGVLLIAGVLLFTFLNADVSTVGKVRFENELRVPPLLEASSHDGRRRFDLAVEQGVSELLPGKRTVSWGISRPYLGPTLRADRGDQIAVNVENRLAGAVTTVHWHGMHLPAAADGGPHQRIAPGDTWSPTWMLDQRAATLWYHAHPHGKTADQVYRGLAGMFIVDDPESRRLSLPDDYGRNDIPLIIQDKEFEDDGALDDSNRTGSVGLLGDEILVNGTYAPYLEVRHERIRLRLLNASNARVYNVGFDDDRAFQLVASDAGLLAAPERLNRLQLSPGERAELVVAFAPGDRVVLRSFEPALGGNFFEERFSGGDDEFDLLELRAGRELTPSRRLPSRLVALPPHDPDSAVRERRFVLQGQSLINGKEMDMSRIDEVMKAGTAEVWEVENSSGTAHNFHPHGVSFRVLDYAGGAPPSHLRGLKDTVYVPPNESVRLLVGLEDYSDPGLPYMFHCHVLQHEDNGMMGQFTVTGGPD
jgi:FtsP/CotA-like multicopper oxidase with cupredoxin domain